jgi:hypothetical protein
MSKRFEWDFPPTIDYEKDRRGVYSPRRRRSAISFAWCLLIVTVAAIVILRFFWPAVILLSVMFGITSPGETLAMIIVLVIIGAVALHDRLK